MKFLNKTEKEGIQQVVACAEEWGYGNLIDRLHAAWTLKTLRNYPEWDIKFCMLHAHMRGDERLKRWPKMSRESLVKELADYIGEEV